jgi:hypothetical protein
MRGHRRGESRWQPPGWVGEAGCRGGLAGWADGLAGWAGGLAGWAGGAPGFLAITSTTGITSISGHPGPGVRWPPVQAAVIEVSFWW